MTLKDYQQLRIRIKRIKSSDNKVFTRAFLEALFSTESANENFSDTRIAPQLKINLTQYVPRFKTDISDEFLKQVLPAYINFIQNAPETESIKSAEPQKEIIGKVTKAYLISKFQAIPLNHPRQYLLTKIEQVLK